MRHESQQNPHVLIAYAFGAAGVDSHCAGWDRGKVERFATLPPGEAHPEGIAVDRDGNVYVVTVAQTNRRRLKEHSLCSTCRASTCGPSTSRAQRDLEGAVMSTIEVGELLYTVTLNITGMKEYGVSFAALMAGEVTATS